MGVSGGLEGVSIGETRISFVDGQNGRLVYAERYRWGVLGTRPEPSLARALEAYLILTADHGMNASTFAARVATSTAADAGAALVAAIATLSGPLHGGAPGPVLDMLDVTG